MSSKKVYDKSTNRPSGNQPDDRLDRKVGRPLLSSLFISRQLRRRAAAPPPLLRTSL